MPDPRFLIDTHTFLWMAAEPERLSADARRVCATGDLILSVASIWEIGIKFQLGRLPLPATPETYIARQVRSAGITILPIHYAHALKASALPGVHKDPFDRMLAAQCLVEKMACVTKDKNIGGFGVEVIW
jgi:PIN domain nuclease of toxin-antitoxin system